MRVLELFSGIGGVTAAIKPWGWTSVAVDQSPISLSILKDNFPTTETHELNLEDVSEKFLEEQDAALWWMSPPCQPFTIKGTRRDLDDPRTTSLKRLIPMISRLRPQWIALENVLGFRDSRAHQRLTEELTSAKYQIREFELCPSEFGIPNLRPRFFLLADRDGMLNEQPSIANPIRSKMISDYLDNEPNKDLFLADELVEKFRNAIHLLDPNNPIRPSICFASAYGRQMIRSGSFLKTKEGFRRFSPKEVLRLLQFPEEFKLASDLRLEKAWQLAGNSVSVHSVRHVLSHLPIN